jgi:hypothetical protein
LILCAKILFFNIFSSYLSWGWFFKEKDVMVYLRKERNLGKTINHHMVLEMNCGKLINHHMVLEMNCGKLINHHTALQKI